MEILFPLETMETMETMETNGNDVVQLALGQH